MLRLQHMHRRDATKDGKCYQQSITPLQTEGAHMKASLSAASRKEAKSFCGGQEAGKLSAAGRKEPKSFCVGQEAGKLSAAGREQSLSSAALMTCRKNAHAGRSSCVDKQAHAGRRCRARRYA